MNGVLKCTRNESTSNPLSPSSQRASSIRPGPKPRWEALEITLVNHIRECHAQRIAVTRVTVIHKALEFEPNFLGGVLSENFVRRSMR